jgi:hypothetical protein
MSIRTVAVCIAALAGAGSAPASMIVTQIESRANSMVWLLNLNGQQGTSHGQVVTGHSVSSVAVFEPSSLADADVVYLSPSNGQLALTVSEIDALEAFVNGGGRLVVATDHSLLWTNDFLALAARFDVTYGTETLTGVQTATVIDFDNPITNGPAGPVSSFNASGPNDGLTSANPDFVNLATYPSGAPALGYLGPSVDRLGDAVFLSDFNSFDDDHFADLDNQALWANLFVHSAVPQPGGLILLGLLFPPARRRRG